MKLSEKGLIIRESPLKESDKLLTVLTAEHGKISVYAHGVRSFKSKYLHSASLLSYSSFELSKRGEYLTLCEASEIESFLGAQYDLELYALCQYICDVVNELTVYDSPEESMLSLTLNTLWALCNTKIPPRQIKAAFEIRAMTECGFMPDVDGCTECGKTDGEMIFDIMNAILYCPECAKDTEEITKENELSGVATILKRIGAEALCAMRYVIGAHPKRIFSFSLTEEALDTLGSVSESYILNHIGHGFTTLNFYKETCRLVNKNG